MTQIALPRSSDRIDTKQLAPPPGDGDQHSDAPLGAFAALAPRASEALSALECGALSDPGAAAERWHHLLRTQGIESSAVTGGRV